MRNPSKSWWVLWLAVAVWLWPALGYADSVRLVAASSIEGDRLSAEWLPATNEPTSPANLVYTLHVSEQSGFIPSDLTAKLTQTDAYGGVVFGLTPATRYYVKVVATDDQGLERWSNELGVTTAALDARTSLAAVRVQGEKQAPRATKSGVSYADGASAPRVGEYLTSAVGGGYLRKVTGARVRNGRVDATTEAASLNEVFDDLELHSTIKLGPLPVASTPSGRRKSLAHAPGSQMNWPETGLSLSDEGAEPGAAPSPRRLSVDGDTQTNQKKFTAFSGPASLEIKPGQLNEFFLEAKVIKDPGRMKICSIRMTDFTHKDRAMRAIIKQDKAAGQGLQEGAMLYTGPSTNVEQSARLRMVWPAEEKYVHKGGLPYVATFEAIVDARNDGCEDSLLNQWAETLELEVPLYVTLDELPGKETKTLKFQGEFSVTNEITFDMQPEVEVGAVIRAGELREATLAVNADIGFQQQLTIQAKGSARLREQRLTLLPPRRFVKVFAAGPVPVVVSGVFRIDAWVRGEARGELKLTETLKYDFPDARFGLEYKDGGWRKIREFKPEYTFRLGGEGDAGANVTVTLIPDLQISFYDAATGRLLVEPYLYADAGIHGQFSEQTGSGGDFSDLDYWFTKLEAGGGLNLRLYAGLHIFDYNLGSYPKGVEIDQPDKFERVEVIEKTPIAGIPRLSAKANFIARPREGDSHSRVVLVNGRYKNVANPFRALFGAGPEAFIQFDQWTPPKVVGEPEGTSLVPDFDGSYWFQYTKPGTYEVRLSGYSDLGSFVRQIAPLTLVLTDDDGDGMVDQWEKLWGVDDPDGDLDEDGKTNLAEFRAGTRPNDQEPPVEVGIGLLNDTGITTCSDWNTNGYDCPLVDFPGQDGDYGRDVTNNDDGDGHAGFSFTKIDGSGNDLAASASEWSCVRDNVTGLLWEVKTDDGGLHDWDWRHTWYEPDPAKNGGFVGYQNGGSCGGTSECDTHGYVEAVNRAGWCGHKDWRMPTVEELEGIVSFDRYYPSIDAAYFPRTVFGWHWSGSPYAGSSGSAWVVSFDFGDSYYYGGRYYGGAVRLVRGGQ